MKSNRKRCAVEFKALCLEERFSAVGQWWVLIQNNLVRVAGSFECLWFLKRHDCLYLYSFFQTTHSGSGLGFSGWARQSCTQFYCTEKKTAAHLSAFSTQKLFTSIIRIKTRIYIFLANIRRFTTQKLARRCSELLLCNRNAFSSKVSCIRNRTGLGSTLRLQPALAKLIINTMFITQQKVPAPFLKHLGLITTSLLDLNSHISVQWDVTLISLGKSVLFPSS